MPSYTKQPSSSPFGYTIVYSYIILYLEFINIDSENKSLQRKSDLTIINTLMDIHRKENYINNLN